LLLWSVSKYLNPDFAPKVDSGKKDSPYPFLFIDQFRVQARNHMPIFPTEKG